MMFPAKNSGKATSITAIIPSCHRISSTVFWSVETSCARKNMPIRRPDHRSNPQHPQYPLLSIALQSFRRQIALRPSNQRTAPGRSRQPILQPTRPKITFHPFPLRLRKWCKAVHLAGFNRVRRESQLVVFLDPKAAGGRHQKWLEATSTDRSDISVLRETRYFLTVRLPQINLLPDEKNRCQRR